MRYKNILCQSFLFIKYSVFINLIRFVHGCRKFVTICKYICQMFIYTSHLGITKKNECNKDPKRIESLYEINRTRFLVILILFNNYGLIELLLKKK